jgi:hypothetical protein
VDIGIGYPDISATINIQSIIIHTFKAVDPNSTDEQIVARKIVLYPHRRIYQCNVPDPHIFTINKTYEIWTFTKREMVKFCALSINFTTTSDGDILNIFPVNQALANISFSIRSEPWVDLWKIGLICAAEKNGTCFKVKSNVIT